MSGDDDRERAESDNNVRPYTGVDDSAQANSHVAVLAKSSAGEDGEHGRQSGANHVTLADAAGDHEDHRSI